MAPISVEKSISDRSCSRPCRRSQISVLDNQFLVDLTPVLQMVNTICMYGRDVVGQKIVFISAIKYDYFIKLIVY